MCIFIHMHIHTNIHTYINTCTCSHTTVHLFGHAHYTHTHTYIYIYTYPYILTYSFIWSPPAHDPPQPSCQPLVYSILSPSAFSEVEKPSVFTLVSALFDGKLGCFCIVGVPYIICTPSYITETQENCWVRCGYNSTSSYNLPIP